MSTLLFNAKHAIMLEFVQVQCPNNQWPHLSRAKAWFRLQEYATKQEYEHTFDKALQVLNLVPGSYYGFHRAAQTHLIRGEFVKGFKLYSTGLNVVAQQDENEVLPKLVDKITHTFNQIATDFGNRWKYERISFLATTSIESLPAAPTGYLRVAGLILMQRKSEQGLKPEPIAARTIPHLNTLQESESKYPTSESYMLDNYDHVQKRDWGTFLMSSAQHPDI
ncbi:hypothetical protein BJV82DRAFT_712850 [Fennellomyces sp. T-0311]|nr:hypothetical protein BJV82DRAFT_712850 [Fennellomyces sp. T-0311]